MLEKIIVIDQIEVLEMGHIQVRQATKIMGGIEMKKYLSVVLIATLFVCGNTFAAEEKSLKKVVVIDQIEVTEFGHVQVRQATKIMEDGKEIGKTYHRHVLSPGDSLEGQDEKVQAIARAVWTPEVIEAYKAQVETQRRIP